jgi:UDP-N-acetylglucosamine--N-acetylmuramyl-(pentapeptide) pyrophosphoryl-undecaprenol N-acetylglucosamine transferase
VTVPDGFPRPLRVLIAGGGTAGHVEPALSVADALRRRFPDVQVTALGTSSGLEARLVPERGYPLETIPRVPLPRGLSKDLITVPTRLGSAVSQTTHVIDRIRPHVVVGFGGYVALPAYLAARRRGRPIVVHEANARPGLANRIGSRLTRFVATSTPDARLPHARLTGIPLRRSVAILDREAACSAARKSWGLQPLTRTLLVFGGSQGARRINEAVAGAVELLQQAGVQVLHAAGPDNPVTGDPTGDPPYIVVPYIDEMDQAYAAADLVVCRSGAMSCAEIAAVGLPAVFVPYPHSNQEQEVNARPLLKAGAAVLVPDDSFTASRLLEEVVAIIDDPARLTRMGQASAALGHRDADEAMVDMIVEAAATVRMDS